MERHYKTLGIEPGASLEEIKTAYRQMVKIWHPDRFSQSSALKPVADENVKRINEAYRALLKYHLEFKGQRGESRGQRSEIRRSKGHQGGLECQWRHPRPGIRGKKTHAENRKKRKFFQALGQGPSKIVQRVREFANAGRIQWLYCLIPGLGILLLRQQAAKEKLLLSPAAIKGLTIACFVGFSLFFLAEMAFGHNTLAIVICWIAMMGLLAKKVTVKAPSSIQLVGFLTQINMLVTVLFLMATIRFIAFRSV